MALTVALLGAVTFNTTAGDKTVVATPAVGDMIVVIAAASAPTGAGLNLVVTDNNSAGHGTYTPIISTLKNVSADPMIAFVRADPIRSATSTTWTSVQTASTGGGLAVFKITGATISGPAFIRQSGSQNNHAAAAAPAVPLGVAALTTNALITAVFDAAAPPGLTSPTGFVAAPGDVNASYTVTQNGLAITHANSGITASTITWGSSDATAFCSLALEMKADVGKDPTVGNFEDLTKTSSNAFKRAAFF